jgi:hypothetical protein
MYLKLNGSKLLCLVFLILGFNKIVFGQTSHDIVNGNLIQFNDNGSWCWYQDERALVNSVTGKLILGSNASGSGSGGSARNGVNQAVFYDLQAKSGVRYDLWKSGAGCDDHDAPGFILRPDGKYLAMYSAHYDMYDSRYRIFDGTTWTTEADYDWTKKPGGTDYTIAYSNVFYLSAENRMYNFARANHRAPNFLISSDMGNTWTFGGQLTTNYSSTYNKGYYKYWSNGVDRIDFVFTEQHPRDTTTSIYHGYLKNGKTYTSDGTIANNNIYDTLYIPTFKQFTKVFGDSTVINGVAMRRCWNTDVQRYDDGTISTIVTARANDNTKSNDVNINPQHCFIYCRYDGTKWTYTYLGYAGYKLYSSEADYTGLAALCPNDPNTIYISTSFDPRDNTKNLKVREIFKGVTSDNGATWSWTPITQNSTRDNFRPIVPSWDKDNSVLLWVRGSYYAAQSFDASIVGIITRKQETVDLMTYVDASTTNTTFADGSALITTGPDANAGSGDGKWHLRTGVGNGKTVFTSSEVSGEDAPALKTTISVPKSGTYDLWVNFWADPTADWRIKAGLTTNSMQVFRHMASQQVVDGTHTTKLDLADTLNTFLYQAYLGRVQVSTNTNIDVYIDDQAYRVGTSTLTGNTVRTWYDGISFANVSGVATEVAAKQNIPTELNLFQNYPNPFNPSTVISYQIPAASNVKIKIFDSIGKEIMILVNEGKPAGKYMVTWNGNDNKGNKVSSGVYFYQIIAGNSSLVKKMLLIK